MNKKRDIRKIQLILLSIVVILTAAVSALYLSLIYRSSEPQDKENQYTGHYSFVVDDLSDQFLDMIYDNICQEAKEKGIYVDKVGADLAGSYTLSEKMEIAIATAPEGIIIKADDSPEIKRLINKAVEKGITVTTILTDIQGSDRQSFIGINFYDMGKAYSEQIRKAKSDEICNVAILMNKSLSESSRNSLYQGILENLDSDRKYIVKILDVDYSDDLSIEEGVRTIILNDIEKYDVVVALDQITTAYTYQALVDYNKIGTVTIFGFYGTDNVLKGVRGGNLEAVLYLDPKEIGRQAVNAIYDYGTYGYSSYYVPINITTITKSNVENYVSEDIADEK